MIKQMNKKPKRGKIYIGTSGWHYEAWQGQFYPDKLPKEKMLGYYKNYFKTVEINNTFYGSPSHETFQEWYKIVPEKFVFSVKANRYITHMKKLKDADETVPRLIENVKVLNDKLGPLLFQLPQHWHCNLERLREFVKILPKGYQYTLEFRDPDWFNEEVYQILTDHKIALCIYDFDSRSSPRKVTADFIYIRLHGPGKPYQDPYSKEALQGWAEAISAWSGQGIKVYCYFDNDNHAYAAKNSRELIEMLNRIQ